jgi:3-oxoacyl-[acyl-carrier-protein] synthase III
LTGIRSRRWADRAESPSLLAARAARVALDAARLSPADIDTLIFAATDMDHLEPAAATIVQDHLGLGPASIPIAMDAAIHHQRIALGSGQEMILFGAASGFSIGHVCLRV